MTRTHAIYISTNCECELGNGRESRNKIKYSFRQSLFYCLKNCRRLWGISRTELSSLFSGPGSPPTALGTIQWILGDDGNFSAAWGLFSHHYHRPQWTPFLVCAKRSGASKLSNSPSIPSLNGRLAKCIFVIRTFWRNGGFHGYHGKEGWIEINLLRLKNWVWLLCDLGRNSQGIVLRDSFFSITLGSHWLTGMGFGLIVTNSWWTCEVECAWSSNNSGAWWRSRDDKEWLRG